MIHDNGEKQRYCKHCGFQTTQNMSIVLAKYQDKIIYKCLICSTEEEEIIRR